MFGRSGSLTLRLCAGARLRKCVLLGSDACTLNCLRARGFLLMIFLAVAQIFRQLRELARGSFSTLGGGAFSRGLALGNELRGALGGGAHFGAARRCAFGLKPRLRGAQGFIFGAAARMRFFAQRIFRVYPRARGRGGLVIGLRALFERGARRVFGLRASGGAGAGARFPRELRLDCERRLRLRFRGGDRGLDGMHAPHAVCVVGKR